jgi:uncharacterized protein YcbK (DUF882 family)
MNRAGLTACLVLMGTLGVQNARAAGDTRTITLHHVHTKEDLTVTYKKNGQYDDEAMKKINWIMRDWRKNQDIKMDPTSIDMLWEVYQDVGAKEPIHIICGFRSPDTNNMLRRRSSGVARNSQHTQGKAIDFYIPGVPLEKLRASALRLQGGGVGYYPTSGSPFIHLDDGSVRHWPRMTREQLVKVFPDGRTVHVPTDGNPLPGYALAMADIERGANRTVASPQKRSFLASLFSREKDAEEVDDTSSARETDRASRTTSAKSETTKPAPAAPARVQVASAAEPVVTAAPVPLPPRRPVFQVASAEIKPALARMERQPTPQAGQVVVASLTPNQIVSMRGMWDGADAPGPAIMAETNALSVSSARRTQTASASRDVTASVGPFPNQDRVPADLALAYAAQAEAGSRFAGKLAERAPIAPAVVTSRGAASIASKPVDLVTSSLRATERLDDPWLRGLVLTSSVHHSLVVTQVGEPDFKGLVQFMAKPGSSVLMTFCNDPHLGMTTGQFAGSAVVFPATVTFTPPLRAAHLQ